MTSISVLRLDKAKKTLYDSTLPNEIVVERFAFHHPKLYSRLLMGVLIVVLASGVGSVFANGSEISGPAALEVKPTMEPPKMKTAQTKAVQTGSRPAGWEGVTKLPGKDGSGSTASAASTQRSAATAKPAPVVNTQSVGSAVALGRSMNEEQFGDAHWPALQALWTRESNWNPAARNPSSGACGIPQALPCSKIKDMSPQGQIEWGLQYIKNRYGNPTNAWRFWLANNWY